MKCHCLSSNYMHERSTLNAGKDSFVYGGSKLFLTHDHTAAWTSKCLMRSSSDKMCIRKGIRVQAGHNQTSNMSYIRKE